MKEYIKKSDQKRHNKNLKTYLYLPHYKSPMHLPMESAPFFIPSTSFCWLSSWLTSSCAYHLITVTTFALTICHCPSFSLPT